MSQKMERGFWWAKRRDGGELTVIQITSWTNDPDRPVAQFIGNLEVVDVEDDGLSSTFEFIRRIKPPRGGRIDG